MGGVQWILKKHISIKKPWMIRWCSCVNEIYGIFNSRWTWRLRRWAGPHSLVPFSLQIGTLYIWLRLRI